MSATRSCPQCGASIPADSPHGICPRCLVNVGLGRAVAGGGAATAPASPASRFTPPKPAQLAPYFPQLEVLDLVGHGGMGAVYKARQRGLDRLVALKILPPDVATDPTFAERFGREARTLARLNHPNIVGIHDFGRAGDFYYLIMEYIDGITLRQAIDTGELTPKEALAIVPQICDALQYAHDEGVVHRDIKPENVLLDRRGRAKIADFGLARLLRQLPEDQSLTGTHQVMGTPRYMAPEQMEGSRDVDHRADIYSLGVVFYEMLTRELPLGRFPPPSRKVQVDVRLDDVVLRTLEKEPQRRYQHASELKRDVESISGIAPFPLHLRGLYGYEYRSERQLFGLPLVHIAKGIDPATGRRRVAKGIIAIGDMAVGGLLAIGGTAIGPMALGGAAFGLYTVGGASVGLLGALGGAALGMGVSGGGAALGTVAAGGGAVGVYAYGGGAAGVHVCSGAGCDPAALRLWTEMAGPLPVGVWVVLGFLTPLVLLLLLLGLAALFARPAPSVADRTQLDVPPRRDPFGKGDAERVQGRSSPAYGCLLALLLIAPLFVFCLMGILAVGFWSFTREVAQPAATLAVQEMPPAPQPPVPAYQPPRVDWQMTETGPAVSDFLALRLNLRGDQREKVDGILQSAFQKYRKIEREFWWQENPEPNRVVTRIKAFPSEFKLLEHEVWTELDQILIRHQQGDARQLLPLRPLSEARPGIYLEQLVKPGILGWGGDAVEVEVQQMGTWYRWRIVRGNYSTSGGGPQLPDEYARFWDSPSDQAPPNESNDKRMGTNE